jgi:peptide/nickel transport system substrate-binding protein
MRIRSKLLPMLAVAAALAPTPSPAETVLRAIPQVDLRSLDPIWTTAAITLIHGYMIYDVLFAPGADLQPKPQMVDKWSVSDDGLLYTFTLRPGMTWHDGSPVTARDAVASIRRWGARAVDGQVLMARTEGMEASGDLTFTLRLKQRHGQVLQSLGNSVLPAFIMREKDALTDPFTQITEAVGSGPFVFVKDEFRPGSRVVYRKNPDYKPRSEPPDALAGGKIAKVDRVEWSIIPDTSIAAAALGSGEVDVMERPSFDLLPILRKNPDIRLAVTDKIGAQAMVRPNFLAAPFDKLAMRKVLMSLADQNEYLAAMVGDETYQRPCPSPFVCGTPSESKLGVEAIGKPDPAHAKALLKEAGYSGEPIVIMDPTDQPENHAMTLVTAGKLRALGVNVDLQAMDWSTLTARRPVKDPPGKDPRGWHMFHTTWPGQGMWNPITNSAAASPCDGKNWFGWVCDEELEKRRLAYLDATDDAGRKAAIEKLQERYLEVVPFVPLGQFLRPIAFRKNVSGFVDGPYIVYWNVEKKS